MEANPVVPKIQIRTPQPANQRVPAVGIDVAPNQKEVLAIMLLHVIDEKNTEHTDAAALFSTLSEEDGHFQLLRGSAGLLSGFGIVLHENLGIEPTIGIQGIDFPRSQRFFAGKDVSAFRPTALAVFKVRK